MVILSSLRRLFKRERSLTDLRAQYITAQEASDEPWASFDVIGFEENGRIKVRFHWNDAFIVKLNELGFQAETEEESVQLFFYASQMRPTSLGGDDPVQSDEHPQLSGQQNLIRT